MELAVKREAEVSKMTLRLATVFTKVDTFACYELLYVLFVGIWQLDSHVMQLEVQSVFTSSPLSVCLCAYMLLIQIVGIKRLLDDLRVTADKMTTTVVNNLVFRAFFEKQRLTGPNFIEWYRNLRIVLSVEDKLPFLEQPIPAMPVPPVEQVLPPDVLATHAAWVKASKEIAGLMLMTIDLDIQKNLEQLGAYDMLKELKTLAEQELLQIRSFFRLREIFTLVSRKKGISLILISLCKEFDGFVQNYNMHSMGKTVNELHAMLKLHEQTLPKNNAPALHAIRAGKVQKGNNKHKKHVSPKLNRSLQPAKGDSQLV
ncbi:hypothetical protein Tco_0251921 [Tanacetum coccineum]